MNEAEEYIENKEAERIEKDREKWIIDRKRQRDHFKLLSIKMIRLNRNPNVDTAEEIWKAHIKPNIGKTE